MENLSNKCFISTMGKYLQNTFLILRFSTHKNKKTNIQRNAFNFLVVYDLLCMNCAMFAQNKSCSISVVGFPNWHVSGCIQEQVGWGTWLHIRWKWILICDFGFCMFPNPDPCCGKDIWNLEGTLCIMHFFLFSLKDRRYLYKFCITPWYVISPYFAG